MFEINEKQQIKLCWKSQIQMNVIDQRSSKWIISTFVRKIQDINFMDS